jgi:hypothetical protein
MSSRDDLMLHRQYQIALWTEGKTPATIAYHEYGLGHLARWLAVSGTDPDPGNRTTETIRAFIRHLTETLSRAGGILSRTSVNTIIRSIESR